jgi:Protein of unknown function (DUF3999)
VRLLPGLLFLLASLGVAAQERPDEFAYSVSLELSGDGALYQIEVPRPVYEGVTRADLGDVRIFNGRGEVVPHAWKPRPTPGTAPAAWVEVPFFPLRGKPGAPIEHLDIRAQRSAEGAIVRIISSEAGKTPPALLGYLVDATAFKHPMHVLDLDWRESGDGVNGSLKVEASDDLQRWRMLVSAAPLLSLEFGGHKLVQKTVDLPAAQYKYLRLTWPAGQEPIELTHVSIRPSDTVLEPARQWKQVPVRAGDKTGDYRFEPGGRIPVDRLRVTLPEPNTLVPAQVLARNADDQPWRTLASGVLYRLTHDGRDVVNADLGLERSGWEQWALRIDPRSGGLGSGVPEIEVGWVPRQLVFVARGQGPFSLAYGNARAEPADLAIQTLVPGWRSDAELKAATATTGPQQMLAGPRALRATPDYKTWTLWASLVLGVALLAWMAWVLARELRQSKPKA